MEVPALAHVLASLPTGFLAAIIVLRLVPEAPRRPGGSGGLPARSELISFPSS